MKLFENQFLLCHFCWFSSTGPLTVCFKETIFGGKFGNNWRGVKKSFQKVISPISFFFLRSLFTYFYREGKGGRKGEKHQCVVASCAPPTVNPACNPHTCPDEELNRLSSSSQASAQSYEPHSQGSPISIRHLKALIVQGHLKWSSRLEVS